MLLPRPKVIGPLDLETDFLIDFTLHSMEGILVMSLGYCPIKVVFIILWLLSDGML